MLKEEVKIKSPAIVRVNNNIVILYGFDQFLDRIEGMITAARIESPYKRLGNAPMSKWVSFTVYRPERASVCFGFLSHGQTSHVLQLYLDPKSRCVL